jgi:hypothetical protein
LAQGKGREGSKMERTERKDKVQRMRNNKRGARKNQKRAREWF